MSDQALAEELILDEIEKVGAMHLGPYRVGIIAGLRARLHVMKGRAHHSGPPAHYLERSVKTWQAGSVVGWDRGIRGGLERTPPRPG